MSLEPLGGAQFWTWPEFGRGYNMEHESQTYAPGSYATLGRWEDDFDSVKIAPGCRVTMYEHPSFNPSGGKRVTQPPGDVVTTVFDVPDVNHNGMWLWKAISSVKVECDGPKYCEKKPSVTGPDCTTICEKNTACMRSLAEWCSDRLNEPKCRKLCEDPANGCNATKVETYCTTHPSAPECECLNTAPETTLDRKLDRFNGGNRMCWSRKCMRGTSPKPGQLIPAYWLSPCRKITICEVDLGDTQMTTHGRSNVNIVNDCDSNSTTGGAPAPPPVSPSVSSASRIESLKAPPDESPAEPKYSGTLILVAVVMAGFLMMILMDDDDDSNNFNRSRRRRL